MRMLDCDSGRRGTGWGFWGSSAAARECMLCFRKDELWEELAAAIFICDLKMESMRLCSERRRADIFDKCRLRLSGCVIIIETIVMMRKQEVNTYGNLL